MSPSVLEPKEMYLQRLSPLSFLLFLVRSVCMESGTTEKVQQERWVCMVLSQAVESVLIPSRMELGLAFHT